MKEKVFRAMTLRSFETSPRKNKNEHNTFREITRRGGKENRNSAGENGERTRVSSNVFPRTRLNVDGENLNAKMRFEFRETVCTSFLLFQGELSNDYLRFTTFEMRHF